jgi:hypothetical protein
MKPWAHESELVKEALEEAGRTRPWLCAETAVEPGTMDHYLAGSRRPPNPVLKLMEQALPALKGKLLAPAEEKSSA